MIPDETLKAPLPADGICPNAAGWPKAPDVPQKPFKTMAWANNTPKDKFGCTREGGTKFHGGIDIKAAIGTDCLAIADGVVTDIGFGQEVGSYVALQFEVNGKKYGAGYCHLKSQSVKIGDAVKAGQKLGETGTSGNVGTDEPHLHLEIHTNKWLTYKEATERAKASLNPNGYV